MEVKRQNQVAERDFSVGVYPSWETDDMNPSDKRKSEYRKRKAAFEGKDWPAPTPQSFDHWALACQVDHPVTALEADPDQGPSLGVKTQRRVL